MVGSVNKERFWNENRGKRKGQQSRGIEPRTTGLCSQWSATELHSTILYMYCTGSAQSCNNCTWMYIIFISNLPYRDKEVNMQALGVLTAHTECVRLRHFSTTCAIHVEDCDFPVVVAQWQSTGCTSQVSWVRFCFPLFSPQSLFIPTSGKSFKRLVASVAPRNTLNDMSLSSSMQQVLNNFFYLLN